MTLLGKHKYRIAVDFGKVGDNWIDYETEEIFYFPSGVGLQIEVAVRENKPPEVESFYDLSNVASIKLEIKERKNGRTAPDADAPAYMSQEVTTLDSATVDLNDWQTGVSQHATFDYVAADTALPIDTYFMILSGVLNNGDIVTFGSAQMKVVQDGTGPETTVAPLPNAVYSASEVDALIAAAELGGDTSIRGVGIDPSAGAPSDGDVLVYRSAGSDYVLEPKSTGTGNTNLSYTASPTEGEVASDTGTNATIPAGSAVNASLMLPADKGKLDAITGTNTGDEPAASTTVPGISELATSTEIDAGTDDTRAITPLGLAGSALKAAVDANTAKVSADGSVTSHSDVTDAGSGEIITPGERLKLGTIENRSNHTGTQTASTISDFDTEVSNNSSVTANTAKVSADGSVTSHSDVTSAGSGQIITTAERSTLDTAIQPGDDVSLGNVTLGADKTLTIDEHTSAPSTPPTGSVVFYAKSDGKVYVKDDTGTETDLTSTGSSAAWGGITGTLSSQTDLQSALDTKIETNDVAVLNAVELNASGHLEMQAHGTSPPNPPANGLSLYVKTGEIFQRNSSGTQTNLSALINNSIQEDSSTSSVQILKISTTGNLNGELIIGDYQTVSPPTPPSGTVTLFSKDGEDLLIRDDSGKITSLVKDATSFSFQSSTVYTMSPGDEGKIMELTNASPCTVTLIEFSGVGARVGFNQDSNTSPLLGILPSGMTVATAYKNAFEALTQGQTGFFICSDATPGAQVVKFI